MLPIGFLAVGDHWDHIGAVGDEKTCNFYNSDTVRIGTRGRVSVRQLAVIHVPLLTRTGTRYKRIGTDPCVSIHIARIGTKIGYWNLQGKGRIGTELTVSVRAYWYAYVHIGMQTHFLLF